MLSASPYGAKTSWLAFVALLLVGTCSCSDKPVCGGQLCNRLEMYLENKTNVDFPQSSVTKKVLELLAEIYWDLERVVVFKTNEEQLLRPHYDEIKSLLELDELKRYVEAEPKSSGKPKCDQQSRAERENLKIKYQDYPVLKAYIADTFDKQARFCAHNSIEYELEGVLKSSNQNNWTRLFMMLDHMENCPKNHQILETAPQSDGALPKCIIEGISSWLATWPNKPTKGTKFDKFFHDELLPMFFDIPDDVFEKMGEYFYWVKGSPQLVLNLSGQFENAIQVANIGQVFVQNQDANKLALQKAIKKSRGYHKITGKLKSFF